MSISFDVGFLTGERKWRLPAVVYLANRYLLLFAMIGIIIALDTTSKINCQVLYTFNQLAGDAAVGLASANLAIRTAVIWRNSIPLIVVLVLLAMGHWSLILQGVQLKATWVDGVGCVITETNNKILAAIFIYSMCFDLLIVILTTIKLWGPIKRKLPAGTEGFSKLPELLFTQGLVYFVVAFLANLLASIFMVLSLSPIMSIVFNVPAAVFSTIVACRAVRYLSEYHKGLADNQGSSIERPVSTRRRSTRRLSGVVPAFSSMRQWIRNAKGRRDSPQDVIVNVSTNCVQNIDPCDGKRPHESSTDLEIGMELKKPHF